MREQEWMVSGSQALQAQPQEYNVYEANPRLKALKKQKLNTQSHIATLLAVTLLFAAGLGLMFRYIQITKLSYQTEQMAAKYDEMQKSNARLRAEIDQATDLHALRDTAEKKMGMQKPDQSQMIYVKVTQKDQTQVFAQAKSSEGTLEHLAGSVLRKIGSWF